MAPTLVFSAVLFASSAFAASVASFSSPVASSNVCTQAPFAAVLPLSTYGPAAAFCTSTYPAAACKNVTTTLTDTATATSTTAFIDGTFTLTTGTSTVSTTVAVFSFTSTTATFSTSSITGTSTQTLTAPPVTTTLVTTTTATVTTTVTSAATVNAKRNEAPSYFVKLDQPSCTVKPGACTTYTTTYLVPVVTVISEPKGYPTAESTGPSSYGGPGKEAPFYSAPQPTAPSYSVPAETGSSASTESCSSTLTPSKPSYTAPVWSSWGPNAQNSTFVSAKKSSAPCTTGSSASSYAPLPKPSAATTSSVDRLSSLFSSLKVQPASFISTACSCIESHALCTTASRTSTTTVTVTTSTASTVTTSVEVTETTSITASTTYFTDTTTTNLILQTDSATFTPTVTTTLTLTVTTTTTSTVLVTPTGNVCVDGTICNSHYRYRTFCGGKRIAPGNYDTQKTYYPKDLEACYSECAADPLCQAFDYNVGSQQCIWYDNAANVYALTVTDVPGWDSGYVYDYC